jgi:very-short-patch-repair endonuclease
VDLGHPGRRVALEAEGFAFHAATRQAFDRDLRRYDELARAGWTVLRFNWGQVVFRPSWVVAVVRDVLASRAA